MRGGILSGSSGRGSGPVVQKLPDGIVWEDNFLALLVLSSRCSGGSSQGFLAGNL